MKITIEVITDDETHEKAIKKLSSFMKLERELTSKEAALLDVLSAMISEYEAKRWPLDISLTPVEAVKMVMSDRGLKQVDLVPIFGNKSAVSAFLNRKRELTVKNIRDLSSNLHIPTKLLVGSEF